MRKSKFEQLNQEVNAYDEKNFTHYKDDLLGQQLKNNARKKYAIGGIGTGVAAVLLLTTGLSFGFALPAIWIAGSICGAGTIASWVGTIVARRSYRKYKRTMKRIEKYKKMKADSKGYTAEQYAALELKINKGLNYLVKKRMIPTRVKDSLSNDLLTYIPPKQDKEQVATRVLTPLEVLNAKQKTFSEEFSPAVQNGINGTVETYVLNGYGTGAKLNDASLDMSIPVYNDKGNLVKNVDGGYIYQEPIKIKLNSSLESAVAPFVLSSLMKEFGEQNKMSLPIKYDLYLNGEKFYSSEIVDEGKLDVEIKGAFDMLNKNLSNFKIPESQVKQQAQQKAEQPKAPQPEQKTQAQTILEDFVKQQGHKNVATPNGETPTVTKEDEGMVLGG